MDFFERQEDARRASGLLAALFGGAALLTLTSVYAVLLALAWAGGVRLAPPFWWQPLLLLAAALLTGALLGGAAWRALHRLKKRGGPLVAHRLGARPLRAEAPGEQVLQNVVEEMAIAAGLPAPWTYVLENQPGVNAMAAGYTPSDAVLIVTDGALAQLSRDALQGMVAHEFSHILYGDMRLNTRLLGLLQGLTLFPRAGAALLHFLFPSETGGCLLRLGLFLFAAINVLFFYVAGAPALLALAGRALAVLALLLAALVVLAGVGALFGRLLQRAVARQREFLADAAAVQFTRYSAGLAGALRAIGEGETGAHLLGLPLRPARHFFFADPQPPPFFRRLLSSHPPLAERLGALPDEPPPPGAPPVAASARNGSPLANVGNPSGAHLGYGRTLREAFPPALREAAHRPLGAEALVYGLLLKSDADVRRQQQAILEEETSEEVREALRRLRPALADLPARARLPLVELLAPALRAHFPAQAKQFRHTLRALAAADRSLSIFEFSLAKMVDHWMEPAAPRRNESAPADLGLAAPDCQLLLSALAHAGHGTARDAERAFTTAAHHLADAHRPGGDASNRNLFSSLALQTDVDPRRLDEALGRLIQLAPTARRQVLDAGARCVMADGRATVREAELLRVVATLLECPLPPFLPQVD